MGKFSYVIIILGPWITVIVTIINL